MCLYRLYNYVTSKYHKLHVLVDKSISILTIYNICSYDIRTCIITQSHSHTLMSYNVHVHVKSNHCVYSPGNKTGMFAIKSFQL